MPATTSTNDDGVLPVVLFVEDDPGRQAINRDICKGNKEEYVGYHIDNLQDALAFLKSDSPRVMVLVSDMKFPPRTGEQAMWAGQRLVMIVKEQYSHIKCIGCSAEEGAMQSIKGMGVPTVVKGAGYADRMKSQIMNLLPKPGAPMHDGDAGNTPAIPDECVIK